jgi:hypothetical protein
MAQILDTDKPIIDCRQSKLHPPKWTRQPGKRGGTNGAYGTNPFLWNRPAQVTQMWAKGTRTGQRAMFAQ